MSTADPTVLTMRIDAALRARLEALARSAKRSKSFLAAEAIAAYVELNEWQIGEITAGMTELDAGEALSEKEAEERYSRLLPPRWRRVASNMLRAVFAGFEDTRERIAADNPTAASRMIERIRASVTRLAASPNLGRPGRVAGTRELVKIYAPIIQKIDTSYIPPQIAHTLPGDQNARCS